MIIPWRRAVTAGHLLDDACSAVTAADWSAGQTPVAWMHWPVDNANPYQDLLSSRFAGHNLIPIRLPDLTRLDGLLAALPTEMVRVLHVHWLYAVTAGSTSASAAGAKVEAFENRLLELRSRGVRVVWTVHNLLPHETVYPDVERRLREVMLTHADLVHVMHDSHPELLESTFGVRPRATLVASHPSFVGAYPDWVDPAAARAQLGIPLGTRVLTTFGQIRPYKGHDAFLDVLDRAVRLDPRLRWLVAGKVRNEPGGLEFIRRASRHPAVLLHPTFVPDRDVQYFLRAADAAVYPYRSSLNSGAVALTASFDLPAYASTGTRIADLMPEGAVVRFDLDQPDQAAQTLATGAGIESAPVRAAVRARAHELSPAAVSTRFALAARRLVDAVDVPAGEVPAASVPVGPAGT